MGFVTGRNRFADSINTRAGNGDMRKYRARSPADGALLKVEGTLKHRKIKIEINLLNRFFYYFIFKNYFKTNFRKLIYEITKQKLSCRSIVLELYPL